jgi:hypothetical protein
MSAAGKAQATAPATKAATSPASHNAGPFVEVSASLADQHKQRKRFYPRFGKA